MLKKEEVIQDLTARSDYSLKDLPINDQDEGLLDSLDYDDDLDNPNRAIKV